MSDYFDYLDKKTAPKPAYQRAMPKVEKSPELPVREALPMTVEESAAGDSIIERVKAFWRK
jgi:hypothetical protein